jgi:hypothetical protein
MPTDVLACYLIVVTGKIVTPSPPLHPHCPILTVYDALRPSHYVSRMSVSAILYGDSPISSTTLQNIGERAGIKAIIESLKAVVNQLTAEM